MDDTLFWTSRGPIGGPRSPTVSTTATVKGADALAVPTFSATKVTLTVAPSRPVTGADTPPAAAGSGYASVVSPTMKTSIGARSGPVTNTCRVAELFASFASRIASSGSAVSATVCHPGGGVHESPNDCACPRARPESAYRPTSTPSIRNVTLNGREIPTVGPAWTVPFTSTGTLIDGVGFESVR